jgi:hypothetical protein
MSNQSGTSHPRTCFTTSSRLKVMSDCAVSVSISIEGLQQVLTWSLAKTWLQVCQPACSWRQQRSFWRSLTLQSTQKHFKRRQLASKLITKRNLQVANDH